LAAETARAVTANTTGKQATGGIASTIGVSVVAKRDTEIVREIKSLQRRSCASSISEAADSDVNRIGRGDSDGATSENIGARDGGRAGVSSIASAIARVGAVGCADGVVSTANIKALVNISAASKDGSAGESGCAIGTSNASASMLINVIGRT
jgi:hypothetical protein